MQENSDKTSRSIFVGNIPYEATEEKLMTLFSQAGPVIGFRLVYDRESGKPKGYGFCEYNSPAVASSALRNLNNIDYNGRPLRIGPAAGEQNSAEVAMTNNTTMKPPQESPYGEKVEPLQSGVAICRAVASLPPEQLFDLMQQMKQCIESNPNEARQLLIQNPQLAYALLQAQIIMKIVEPKVAIAMLARSNEQIPQAVIEPIQAAHVVPQMYLNPLLHQHQQPQQMAPSAVSINHFGYHNGNINSSNAPHVPHIRPFLIPLHLSNPTISMSPFTNHFAAATPPISMASNFSRISPPMIIGGQQHQLSVLASSPEKLVMMGRDIGGGIGQKIMNTTNIDQNQDASDILNYLDRHGEKQKATLIMQVLNLTDEQVAMLPEDQRTSIEVLKNQLKKN